MHIRQHEGLLPEITMGVHTSRRGRPLWIAVGSAVLAITLVACGANNNARRGTDPNATPAAEIQRKNSTTSQPDTVRLPDLTDPATRKQFVCSFADGYFTEPQVPRGNSTSDYWDRRAHNARSRARAASTYRQL